MKNLDKSMLEQLVRQIIQEKINGSENSVDFLRDKDESGVISIKLPTVKVDESNRLDTGNPSDVVYTKDLFTLEESPRLGCGIMEMKETTFDWTLNYDEVDYVIEGTLDIIINGKTVSASAGELILIPKGSSIQFSVKDYARFIYVTYPADWASQN
ncbi:cupin domain-containing protein [Bacillus sp. BAU-SS-2023]|nr:cupin domain-containing protein [Bacillus sp. BAU-SS-2023]